MHPASRDEGTPHTWSGIPAATLPGMEPGNAEALLMCLGVQGAAPPFASSK